MNLKVFNLLIDCLLFYVPLKNISLKYGDVIIIGEGLQNLGLCSALKAFEQGGIFIVSHLLRLDFSGLPKDIQSPLTTTQGDVENLFL
jgi:hypothetical protein